MGGNNKKFLDPAVIIVFSFLAMILLGVVMIIVPGNASFYKKILFLLLVACISLVCGIVGILIEKKTDENSIIENMNIFQGEYDNYINKIGIIKRDTQATLIEEQNSGITLDILQYLWVEDNCLKLFPISKSYKDYFTSCNSRPDISKLHLISIPIESISYFEEVGELRKYTTISGGGSTLKGALIGYALADDIGAIIGSREPIKSNTISEDDRKVELIYKNQSNEIVNLEFTHDAYMVLKKLIPEKELKRIIGLNSSNSIDTNKTPKQQTIKEKLEQLNALKAEELITDEEFVEKKRKILDRS